MRRLINMGIYFYIIGLLVLSLGIGFAVQSSLGTSAYDALLVGLFYTFGLSIGTWEIIVGFFTIMMNALLVKKRPELIAFLTSIVTGIGIDMWIFILNLFQFHETTFGKWLYLMLSIILTGLGIAIYLQSRIAPNPIDRTMIIISDWTGWTVTYSRFAISIVLIIIAFFFNGAIGIGTLFNAVFVGMFISMFLPYVTRQQHKSPAKATHDSA